MDRINPHEHTISRQELIAHLVGDVVVINRRLASMPSAASSSKTR
jgi:hypothetical protein